MNFALKNTIMTINLDAVINYCSLDKASNTLFTFITLRFISPTFFFKCFSSVLKFFIKIRIFFCFLVKILNFFRKKRNKCLLSKPLIPIKFIMLIKVVLKVLYPPCEHTGLLRRKYTPLRWKKPILPKMN